MGRDMMRPMQLPTVINQILSTLQILVSIDFSKYVHWVGGFRKPQSLFEVLEFEHSLELLDTKGKSALTRKRKKIRFLKDNVFAIQDHVWGDGELFSEYRCSPGMAVDRYREGQGYAVVISLRESKKLGETQELSIERKIENGFLCNDETFQTKIMYPTTSLTMKVIFPKQRTPKKLTLFEQNSGNKFSIGEGNIHFLPDGRQEVFWSIENPKLFAIYSLSWHW